MNEETILFRIRKLRREFDQSQPGWISDHLILGYREYDELCAFESMLSGTPIHALGEYMGMKILRCGSGITIASSSIVEWIRPT